MASKRELEEKIEKLEKEITDLDEWVSSIKYEFKNRQSRCENRIYNLYDKIENKVDTRSVEPCVECGGLFRKSTMKAVEIRGPLGVKRGDEFYCKTHAPKHDIEERNGWTGETIYKKREGEKEVKYNSKK